MNQSPLFTYRERLLEVRRDFALHRDRVVIEARWFPYRKYEHMVELSALTGEVQKITVRYRMYRYAGWLLAVGALAYAAYYYYAPQDPAWRAAGYVALSAAAVGAVSLVLAYPNRFIRFARFRTKAGRIGLDIGSAGNDNASFEEFVEQVRRQIRRS